MAVRVALDVVELREILGVEVEHEPFGDHRDAVAPAIAETLEIAPTSVSTIALSRIAAGELLGDQRQGRARRLADAEREVAGLAAHRDDEVPARGRLGVDHQVLDDLDAVVPRGLEPERVDVRRQVEVVVDGLRHVTTRMRPPACSSSFIAENAVSSPPMVMSMRTLSRSSEITAVRAAPGPGSDWRARCRCGSRPGNECALT